MVIEADNVVKKYKKARSNLETLKRLGAFLLHGVDATTLHLYPDLRCRKFDRVIFNFPHAGFHGKETDSSLIRKHRELVFGFFHGASRLLRVDGEVHVSHKNKAPFCNWNLEELASRCFLVLIQRVAFEKSNYPGYENKRGDGSRCDQPFILGECSTFKFKLSRVAKELYAEKVKWRQVKEQESNCPQGFINRQPVSFHHGYPQQTEFHGVSERPVSFDLSYPRDYNLKQVQDPCVLSRQRTSPLDLYHHQEHRYSQFEDAQFSLGRNTVHFQYNSIELDKFRYPTRSMLCQDFPFQTNHHRQEQFYGSSNRISGVSLDIHDGVIERMLERIRVPHLYAGESPESHRLLRQDFPLQTNHHRQEQFYGSSNRINGVPLDIHDRVIERILKRPRFPHMYAGESPERLRLLCQDFPVKASQGPLFECSNRSSGVFHELCDWEVRRPSTSTRFAHPYTGESQERSLVRQSNLNIHPPHHWYMIILCIYYETKPKVTYIQKNLSGYFDGSKVTEAWSDSVISKKGVIFVLFCVLPWPQV